MCAAGMVDEENDWIVEILVRRSTKMRQKEAVYDYADGDMVAVSI
jgi:hypothetical protein